MNSLNVPKLRFPGFEGEWQFEKFGKIATNKSGKFNPIKENSFTKCIELEHLETGTGQLLGFIDGSNSGSIKNKFSEGDVLFGKLRPYLKKYLQAPFEGVCSSEIWVLKGVKITNSFLYQIVQTNKFIDIANQSSGSKMPRADWNVVENCDFTFPTFPEQQKIASFLSTVDEKIQQLSRKKELLEQYKKGVMQQLFSGKLRFKDENGKEYPDWEEKKLGELGETYNGLTGKTKEDFGKGKPYIQYKQIFDDSKINISRFELVNISTDEKQKKVMFGDVFFTVSSETIYEIGTASVLLDEMKELYLNSFCFGYRANSLKILSPYFSRYLFRSQLFRSKIVKLAQGSTRYNMSKVQLMKLEIQLPCLKEQQKIANFLSGIDGKIEQVNGELVKTQEFKKGLLQQMFV